MNPLDQLQDISLPSQIHNYPIAPGYWLALALTILALFLLLRAVKRNMAKNKAKKKALKQLQLIRRQIQTDNQENKLDDKAFTQHLNSLLVLLKWSGLQYFSREHIAPLYGEQFKQFLLGTLPEKHHLLFAEQCDNLFALAYQKQTPQSTEQYFQQLENFSDACKIWLSHALPVKALPVPTVKIVPERDNKPMEAKQ